MWGSGGEEFSPLLPFWHSKSSRAVTVNVKWDKALCRGISLRCWNAGYLTRCLVKVQAEDYGRAERRSGLGGEIPRRSAVTTHRRRLPLGMTCFTVASAWDDLFYDKSMGVLSKVSGKVQAEGYGRTQRRSSFGCEIPRHGAVTTLRGLVPLGMTRFTVAAASDYRSG